MYFHYADIFGVNPPESYGRLLLDAMLGDQTLFVRHDDMEVAWSLITPVLNAWEEDKGGQRTGLLYTYSAGSWGPAESDALLERVGLQWLTSAEQ